MKYYVKSEGDTADQAKKLKNKGLSFLIGPNVEWFAIEAASQEDCQAALATWPAIITVLTDDGEETDWAVSRQIEFTYHAKKEEK